MSRLVEVGQGQAFVFLTKFPDGSEPTKSENPFFVLSGHYIPSLLSARLLSLLSCCPNPAGFRAVPSPRFHPASYSPSPATCQPITWTVQSPWSGVSALC